MPAPDTPVAKLKNLGKVTAEWLGLLGIYTLADLERVGSVRAYHLLKAQGRRVTLLGLYAMQGAVLNLMWNELPPEMLEELRRAAKTPPDESHPAL